jgi:hypothetical protein
MSLVASIGITSDINHAIVMTLLAFFNQQQTLLLKQSVKSVLKEGL